LSTSHYNPYVNPTNRPIVSGDKRKRDYALDKGKNKNYNVLKGKKGLESLKKKLEKHYRNEIDLMYEVLKLGDDETHEILEWFATNPAYQGLKEVVDGIRQRGRGEKEISGNSNVLKPNRSEKESS